MVACPDVGVGVLKVTTQPFPYRRFALVQVERAIAMARAAASIRHPGVKGQIREILITQVLRPLLPMQIGVGTGHIICLDGKTISKQHDMVLYDRRLVAPLMFDQSLGLFPVEAVLATIEVKSTLRARALQMSDAAGAELLALGIASGYYDSKTLELTTHTVIHPVSCLFAFASDLKGDDSEADRYDNLCPRATDKAGQSADPHLRVICVVERGSWVWRRRWVGAVDPEPGSEVLSFVASIIDILAPISQSRGLPQLGRYLLSH
jgi:hypothetical protein